MASHRSIKWVLALAVVTVLMLGVAMVSAQDPVPIQYWLWDTNQLPAYEQCATDFEAANPGIDVQITQLGWGDYWTGITTGFVSGTAPDVFTNHLAKYPEFVELAQLVDLQPLVDRDGVATDIYYPGLAELWTRDGARFGLPKDWDTVAIVYNANMVEAAGVDPAELNSLTWNPEDGGTFEQMIARLTLDANGNNGLSPDFDKENVVQYGLIVNGMGEAYGQTEWSWLSNTTGWQHNNGVWGNEYYYDDPRFIATMDWFTGMWLDKGYLPPLEDVTASNGAALFQSGVGAMNANGSWMIGTFLNSDFPVGFARLPEGPEGRKSMFNGLADSIWVGSQHQEEAWQWVKYLASEACQMVVGESGVVFPAIPAAVDATLAMRAESGVDVSAFTDQANEEGGTFLFPITDFGGEISTIMTDAMAIIGLGQGEPADVLPAANEEVNSLFQ
jgi:multiple sugar transport system substrate-binding protein